MSDQASKENCANDYRAVWRFTYECDQRIVQSVDGSGEVETVGHRRVREFYDVIAVSRELAMVLYEKDHGWKFKVPQHPIMSDGVPRTDCNFDNHKLISGPEFLCYVDAEISTTRG